MTRILFCIFCLALVLRLFHLGSLPFGLHEDEMMNGYVGRYILQNGKDLYGNRWPLLYFDNFGDYPPVIPMYLSGLSTYVFGINPFAVRFPIAFFGALAVFPLYSIATFIFSQKKYALFCAFFLAISPWHILLSRSSAENITATTVFLFSLVSLILLQKTNKTKYFVLTVLSSFLLYFLYASFRVTTPLFFFLSVFFVEKEKWKKALFVSFLLFSLLTLAIGRTDWGRGRFEQTSIFYFNHMIQNRITNFQMQEGSDNILLARMFHNKPVVLGREFIRQYLSYISPSTLFMDGGLPHRYLLSDHGLLYLTFGLSIVLACSAPFFQKMSFDSLFVDRGKKTSIFLFGLLLCSPIPAALTLDDVPNIHRSAALGVLLLFPITIAFAVSSKIKMYKFFLQIPLLIILGVEVVYFSHQFFFHTQAIQSFYRGDDRTTLAQYLAKNHNSFDRVYLPNDVKPLFFLFYSQNFDPNLAGKFRENIKIRNIENLYFTDSNCASEEKDKILTQKSLVINRDFCATPADLHEFDHIVRIDGTNSFRLLQK